MKNVAEQRTACRFCEKFQDGKGRHPVFDHVLWEDDALVVVPAIGGFVEGYVLIIPRQHMESVALLPAEIRAKVESAKKMVRDTLTRVYGPPIFFEHGPVTATNRGGACVEHVHLHCVPTIVELLPVLEEKHGPALMTIQRYGDLALQAERRQSYVYYETREGRMVVFSAEGLPSQYMRRLLAVGLGHDGVEWDYAVFDFPANAALTVETLSRASWSPPAQHG